MGRGRGGPANRENPRQDSRCPSHPQEWAKLDTTEGVGGLTWQLVRVLQALQQAIHLGFDPAQLRPDGVQRLWLTCRWRRRTGSWGFRQAPEAQPLPSGAGEGCAPSLIPVLSWEHVVLPGGLVGTEASLDPHSCVGPPDLDRRVVDEWRDPRVFIHPMGQDRGCQASPAVPFTQRTKEAGPTHLRGTSSLYSLWSGSQFLLLRQRQVGEDHCPGPGSPPSLQLTWENRCEAFP